MKADSKMKIENAFNNNNRTVTLSTEKKQSKLFMITILPLIAMLVAILPGILQSKVGIELIKAGVLTFLLTSGATFYIRMYTGTILGKPFAKTIIIISYLISLGLLSLTPNADSLCFWMLGGLVVAMLINQKLGLLLHFNLSFLLGFTLSPGLETVIVVIIMGTLLCFLANALKQKSTAIYAIIIVLSTNVTLAFVMNNFFLEKGFSYNYLNSLFSILGVMVIGFLLSLIYERRFPVSVESEAGATVEAEESKRIGIQAGISQILANEGVFKEGIIKAQSMSGVAQETPEKVNGSPEADLEHAKEAVSSVQEAGIDTVGAVGANMEAGVMTEQTQSSSIEVPESLNSQDSSTNTVASKSEALENKAEEEVGAGQNKIIGTRTSYDVLCDVNNILLQKLKAHSESVFEHSVRISELSEKAANAIGADALLAKVGGLYHEIGKINGKNYIEEGLKLAEEYAFPVELRAIIREHNIKYDKPSSVEAAIVMLADSVVSTVEYIEKNNDRRFTKQKIIENIFQLRLDKGTFDSSKLSLMDYKALKEFFLKEFQ